MSDRYNAFIVILEQDIRDDDAQATINAIKQIKGVLAVKPHVAGPDEAIAETRALAKLTRMIWKALGNPNESW